MDETQVPVSASASRLRSAECRCRAEWVSARPNLLPESPARCRRRRHRRAARRRPQGRVRRRAGHGGRRCVRRPPGRGQLRPTRGCGDQPRRVAALRRRHEQQTTRHRNDRGAKATPPARAFTDARPGPTVRTTSDLQPPHQPPALLVASTVHAPLPTSSRTPALSCLALIAPPRPLRPDQLPPGLTHQVYLDGRGRGPAQRGGPPSSKAQAGSGKRAGGGAAACSRLRRTPRNEHLETNTKKRTGAARERPAMGVTGVETKQHVHDKRAVLGVGKARRLRKAHADGRAEA
jgi:hypothetical protein